MENSDVMKPGRPLGGLAIMWKKNFKFKVKYVNTSPNKRVKALVIEFDDVNIGYLIYIFLVI